MILKNGMNNKTKKIIIGFIVLVTFMLISVSVAADGNAKFGATLINSDSTTIKTSVDQMWELDTIEVSLEVDYLYKEQDNIVKMNKFNTVNKVNIDLTEKYYGFSVLSYDTDKLRLSGDRIVGGAGFGWRIFRNDKWRISNESSIAYLTTDEVSEAIYRNSLWVAYKLSDNLSITNKILTETGTSDYLRNETAITYDLTELITVGFSNTYTEDPIDNNVLSVTIGVKW